MRLKEKLVKLIFDPLVLRIESRISHHQKNRPIAFHDGARWRARANIGAACKFYPDAELINWGAKDQVDIGNSCHVRAELLAFDNGRISIGDHSFLGEGSRIWSHQSVSVGSHVLVSHQVEIHDSNYHSLDYKVRRIEIHERFDEHKRMPDTRADHAPVVIEDDVWIGFKSSILKGVTIGRGAVVAACSVVTKDVPAYTLVAGNPARIVRELPR